MTSAWKLIALIGAAGATLYAPIASACGCFTPPDPSVPVVQAGERIAFAVADSQVTAHIQIQYQGDAKEFGWILPLPSQPTLELGTDELFTQLTTQTQPKYRLTAANSCSSRNAFNGTATPSAAGGAADAGQQSPLVLQDSLGPYDYAILKGDSKDAMLKWLADNHYFVPVGTDDVVAPYVHTGAFFLALKLQSGKTAGDIQPVVVHYASDLPMIPIVLTSVAAQPDMGIQVWMLGAARAIPRNYYHTVIDEAVIDWIKAGANYNDVIIRATKEAKDRHTFVTEYAGTTSIMQGILDPAGRFGLQSDLSAITDAAAYVQYLQSHGYEPAQPFQGGSGGVGGPAFFSQFSGVLVAILQGYFPIPDALVQQGVTPSQFYFQLDYYLGSYRQQHPDQFVDANGMPLSYSFDPAKLTNDIWTRVVAPIQTAAKLFHDYPYMTRLYTTLSPENMTADPVFSYNPDLPDVSNVHQATIVYNCDFTGQQDGATIKTDSGYTIELPDGVNPRVSPASLPASERIEILRESGPPEVIADNRGNIMNALADGSGCSVRPGRLATSTRGAGLLAMLGLLSLVAGRRRRSAR